MIDYKIGQLFFTGVSGTSLTDQEKKFIEEEDIGGVILFAHNYEDPAQIAELCNSIQTLRKEYPLFIGVDQEGGRVQRFKRQFFVSPAMLELAKLDSPKAVFELHCIMAKQLKACGVNVNFSPVCDIFTNINNKVIGDRAFGNDQETVSKLISAAIRGIHNEGLLACAKHFPGHGNTTKDSHISLPILKTSLETLEERELLPFVKASRSRTAFMMMAHLTVDCIDPELPTSLSPKAYKLLRDFTRFKGIVITDDMEMGAIVENYSFGEAASMAINGGADQLIYRSFERCSEVLEECKRLLSSKEISRNRVNESIEKILKSKSENLGEYRPVYIPTISESFQNSSDREQFDSILKSLSELK